MPFDWRPVQLLVCVIRFECAHLITFINPYSLENKLVFWREATTRFDVNIFFSGYNYSILGSNNRSMAQISQCTSAIYHNAPFCNKNVHMAANFCYKMLHCGISVLGIVGFARWVYYPKQYWLLALVLEHWNHFYVILLTRPISKLWNCVPKRWLATKDKLVNLPNVQPY